jgi:hypothetical protein
MAITSEIKSVILRNIEASDWKEPTPIQMQAIPILLANRDILASAPTGLPFFLPSYSLSLSLSVSLSLRLRKDGSVCDSSSLETSTSSQDWNQSHDVSSDTRVS